MKPKTKLQKQVTPYVGVWIETTLIPIYFIHIVSLLMWECGLKHD